MIYKGNFYFDKKNHPGECEVDDENHIYLTINESGLNGYKEKIIGNASNKSLILYSCRLIGNGIGYYKYQVQYMVNNRINLSYRNVDFNKHIQEFRFTFYPLDEWLGFETIKQKNNTIFFNIPKDIDLYISNDLNIKVKYFKEDCVIHRNSIKDVKIVPYICIVSSKVVSIEKIMSYIQMVTRFFALLIGYSGRVNAIKFYKMYKGKKIMNNLEDELIINSDFSNRYYIRIGYPTYNLRSYYKDLNEDIKDIFCRWFNLYFNKKYKEAIVFYYNPYVAHTLEDDLLTTIKCIEKISIAKDNDVEKKQKSKMLHKVLDSFYKKHKKDLEDNLKKGNFKREYIKNIEVIHENIANSIVYAYDNRITLAKRIKDLDSSKILSKSFNYDNCTKKNSNYSVYDYLANTRNYYTHLDNGEYIIKDDYLPSYCRRLEKILIMELLLLIIYDKDFVEERIKIDPYLTLYDDRDL